MSKSVQRKRRAMSAILKIVNQKPDGKFHFQVENPLDRTGIFYHFKLTREKALKLANANSEFPLGAKLNLSGGISKNDEHGLNHVRITAVDGRDLQSWAEWNGSPAVNPVVLSKVQEQADSIEEAMKLRAPPEPPPVFASPQEAYEKAMAVVRRQARLKDPKLSQTEIWVVRDALNFLKADREADCLEIGKLKGMWDRKMMKSNKVRREEKEEEYEEKEIKYEWDDDVPF